MWKLNVNVDLISIILQQLRKYNEGVIKLLVIT